MSNMLNILGSTMAHTIGQDEMVCRGLLRLSIMDNLDPSRTSSDLNQVATHIKTMGYQDWKTVLDGPVFVQRLSNMGIKEPVGVVARLKQTLVEQQSLLTMTAY